MNFEFVNFSEPVTPSSVQLQRTTPMGVRIHQISKGLEDRNKGLVISIEEASDPLSERVSTAQPQLQHPPALRSRRAARGLLVRPHSSHGERPLS